MSRFATNLKQARSRVFFLDILHSEKLKREPPKTIRNRFGGRVVDRITTFFTFSILRLICVIRLMSQ
ncbi:hypothetical protein LEP1GSC048_1859 [Leptospira santarosai serovar Shermani str. 1342KT]|nr:hypothetical protein LEP1GSC048_1859 [Leptospira santarosai serovar Shermani str. 1342KT]